MERASDIQAFSAKLEDRFGRIPHEGKELIRIVTLRQLAKQLGMEKVVLKQEKMNLFFVSDNNIRYFQSPVFGKVLSYLQKNPRQCQLREIKGKRSISITHIKTGEECGSYVTKYSGTRRIINLPSHGKTRAYKYIRKCTIIRYIKPNNRICRYVALHYTTWGIFCLKSRLYYSANTVYT